MLAMSTIATLAEAKAAYLANADYADGSGDLTKAAAFRTACRSLLVLLPQTSASDRHSVTMSVAAIERELNLVQGWIQEHGGAIAAGRVVFGDTGDFRL